MGRPSGAPGRSDNRLVEENYPKSICHRSLFVRPLPSGNRVYFVLLQFVFLNIVGGITEVFFRRLLVEYYNLTVPSSIPTIVNFRSFPLLLCLPMGFIADRYFGRAQVLYYSWISLFIAQLMIAIYFVVVSFVYNNLGYIIGITICSTALLINAIGLAGVRINLISFGADQIRVASSDQLSSYFHWYYWSKNVGQFFTFSVGASLVASPYYVLPLLVTSIAAAAGALIIILGYDQFMKKEKVSINPLLLIYGVLKNAATAKKPVDRTAFSYDGRPEPSRIDLAKETHFGNFPDEQVEDVKTFLRIVVLLISLLGFLIVHTIQVW